MRGRRAEALYYLAFKTVSQGAAFLSGLLCIRALTVHDFAIYSIATVMISVVGVIAEGGTSSTLLRRASSLTSPADQAEQVRAAISVRSRVSIAVTVPATALLVTVLLLNGETPLTTAVVTALVVANIGPTIATSIFLVGLQVTDRFRLIRWLDLGASVLRLALIAAFWATGTANVAILIAISLVVLLVQRAVEARVLRPYLRGDAPPSALRGDYWAAVKQSLPTAVMMVVGEQAVIMILTLVGNVAAIGQIAALGKYAALFTLVNSLLMTVIAPVLARIDTEGAGELRKRGLGVLGIYLAIAGAYVLASAVFSPLLLGLLGQPYTGLGPELIVVSTGVAIANFAVFGLGSINHARGWLRYSWTYLPALAIWLAVGVLLLPLTTSFGAACFSASLSLCVLTSHAWRLAAGWRALRREESGLTRQLEPA